LDLSTTNRTVTDDDIAEFNDTWTLDAPEWMTNLWTSLSVSITMPGTWFIMSLLILGMCDRFGVGKQFLTLLPIFPLLLAKIDVPPSAKYHPYFCLFFFFGDRLELEISCLSERAVDDGHRLRDEVVP
jgi:hypothetical protein